MTFPDVTNPDDEVTRWALRARSGDRDALERFVRATQRDVWRFIAHLADLGAADYLAQETYACALGSLRRFAGRSSARTWLLTIARRVVIDQVRLARSRPRLSPGVDWEWEADRRPVGSGFEDAVELNTLLDVLGPDRREAVVLTQVLGLSYAEAADIVGCPVGTIRSRVARAREDLVRAVGRQRGRLTVLPDARAASPPLLRNAPFLRLWVGTTASGLATWALPFVLGLAVLERTVTAVELGVVLAARTAGFVVAVPVAGVLTDRHSRRRVVWWAGLAAGLGTPFIAVGWGGRWC